MIQFIIVTKSAPMNAAENSVTLNPLMTLPKYQNTKPFTTKENIPRVRTLIGRVSKLIIGRRNILNSVRHAPTISAVQIGSTVTPEIN